MNIGPLIDAVFLATYYTQYLTMLEDCLALLFEFWILIAVKSHLVVGTEERNAANEKKGDKRREIIFPNTCVVIN